MAYSVVYDVLSIVNDKPVKNLYMLRKLLPQQSLKLLKWWAPTMTVSDSVLQHRSLSVCRYWKWSVLWNGKGLACETSRSQAISSYPPYHHSTNGEVEIFVQHRSRSRRELYKRISVTFCYTIEVLLIPGKLLLRLCLVETSRPEWISCIRS